MEGTDGRDAFVRRFGHLFEHSPWVVEHAYEAGPFADASALHAGMMRVVMAAGVERQRRLIAAHPELAAAVALTKDSESEQSAAGLRHLNEADVARFGALNAAYRRKFGLPFIICVRRRDKESILAAFEARLDNDAAAEHAEALAQIGEITRARLADMKAGQVAA